MACFFLCWAFGEFISPTTLFVCWANHVCLVTGRFPFFKVYVDLSRGGGIDWLFSLFAQLLASSYLWLLCICYWANHFWVRRTFLFPDNVYVDWSSRAGGIDWLFPFLLNFLRTRSYLSLFSSFLSPPIPTLDCIRFFSIFMLYIVFVFDSTKPAHSFIRKNTLWGLLEENRSGWK